jgi:hypothetical protein
MSLGEPNQKHDIGRRDAFHVPAALVVSDEHLRAGDYVRFTDRSCTKVVLSSKKESHGVIDPWGDLILMAGYKFWVFINPGLTSDLRHEFIVTLPEDQTIMDRLAENTKRIEAGYPEDVPNPEGATRCEREGCGFSGD